jgi:transcriptional regulator with XRE-family HTH domain
MENNMTGEDFKLWRYTMNLNQKQAADALGISRDTVTNYETGRRRDTGREVEIPLYIALACSALTRGLKPWLPEDQNNLEAK